MWQQVPVMSSLFNPRSAVADVIGKSSEAGFNLVKYIESLGLNLPTFFLLLGVVLTLVLCLGILIIWLYTDYKLNGHTLTDQVISERTRLLRRIDGDDKMSDEDSGSGSESESEAEAPKSPRRTRRTSLSNRVKVRK